MNYTELITTGIKRLRISRNLTQEQFAEKINMSVQGYRNIEQSKYLPTANTIDKICEVFGVKPLDLITPTPCEDLNLLQQLVIGKIKNCSVEKLVKINNMIDLL